MEGRNISKEEEEEVGSISGEQDDYIDPLVVQEEINKPTNVELDLSKLKRIVLPWEKVGDTSEDDNDAFYRDEIAEKGRPTSRDWIRAFGNSDVGSGIPVRSKNVRITKESHKENPILTTIHIFDEPFYEDVSDTYNNRLTDEMKLRIKSVFDQLAMRHLKETTGNIRMNKFMKTLFNVTYSFRTLLESLEKDQLRFFDEETLNDSTPIDSHYPLDDDEVINFGMVNTLSNAIKQIFFSDYFACKDKLYGDGSDHNRIVDKMKEFVTISRVWLHYCCLYLYQNVLLLIYKLLDGTNGKLSGVTTGTPLQEVFDEIKDQNEYDYNQLIRGDPRRYVDRRIRAAIRTVAVCYLSGIMNMDEWTIINNNVLTDWKKIYFKLYDGTKYFSLWTTLIQDANVTEVSNFLLSNREAGESIIDNTSVYLTLPSFSVQEVIDVATESDVVEHLSGPVTRVDKRINLLQLYSRPFYANTMVHHLEGIVDVYKSMNATFLKMFNPSITVTVPEDVFLPFSSDEVEELKQNRVEVRLLLLRQMESKLLLPPPAFSGLTSFGGYWDQSLKKDNTGRNLKLRQDAVDKYRMYLTNLYHWPDKLLNSFDTVTLNPLGDSSLKKLLIPSLERIRHRTEGSDLSVPGKRLRDRFLLTLTEKCHLTELGSKGSVSDSTYCMHSWMFLATMYSIFSKLGRPVSFTLDKPYVSTTEEKVDDMGNRTPGSIMTYGYMSHMFLSNVARYAKIPNEEHPLYNDSGSERKRSEFLFLMRQLSSGSVYDPWHHFEKSTKRSDSYYFYRFHPVLVGSYINTLNVRFGIDKDDIDPSPSDDGKDFPHNTTEDPNVWVFAARDTRQNFATDVFTKEANISTSTPGARFSQVQQFVPSEFGKSEFSSKYPDYTTGSYVMLKPSLGSVFFHLLPKGHMSDPIDGPSEWRKFTTDSEDRIQLHEKLSFHLPGHSFGLYGLKAKLVRRNITYGNLGDNPNYSFWPYKHSQWDFSRESGAEDDPTVLKSGLFASNANEDEQQSGVGKRKRSGRKGKEELEGSTQTVTIATNDIVEIDVVCEGSMGFLRTDDATQGDWEKAIDGNFNLEYPECMILLFKALITFISKYESISRKTLLMMRLETLKLFGIPEAVWVYLLRKYMDFSVCVFQEIAYKETIVRDRNDPNNMESFVQPPLYSNLYKERDGYTCGEKVRANAPDKEKDYPYAYDAVIKEWNLNYVVRSPFQSSESSPEDSHPGLAIYNIPYDSRYPILLRPMPTLEELTVMFHFFSRRYFSATLYGLSPVNYNMPKDLDTLRNKRENRRNRRGKSGKSSRSSTVDVSEEEVSTEEEGEIATAPVRVQSSGKRRSKSEEPEEEALIPRRRRRSQRGKEEEDEPVFVSSEQEERTGSPLLESSEKERMKLLRENCPSLFDCFNAFFQTRSNLGSNKSVSSAKQGLTKGIYHSSFHSMRSFHKRYIELVLWCRVKDEKTLKAVEDRKKSKRQAKQLRKQGGEEHLTTLRESNLLTKEARKGKDYYEKSIVTTFGKFIPYHVWKGILTSTFNPETMSMKHVENARDPCEELKQNTIRRLKTSVYDVNVSNYVCDLFKDFSSIPFSVIYREDFVTLEIKSVECGSDDAKIPKFELLNRSIVKLLKGKQKAFQEGRSASQRRENAITPADHRVSFPMRWFQGKRFRIADRNMHIMTDMDRWDLLDAARKSNEQWRKSVLDYMSSIEAISAGEEEGSGKKQQQRKVFRIDNLLSKYAQPNGNVIRRNDLMFIPSFKWPEWDTMIHGSKILLRDSTTGQLSFGNLSTDPDQLAFAYKMTGIMKKAFDHFLKPWSREIGPLLEALPAEEGEESDYMSYRDYDYKTDRKDFLEKQSNLFGKLAIIVRIKKYMQSVVLRDEHDNTGDQIKLVSENGDAVDQPQWSKDVINTIPMSEGFLMAVEFMISIIYGFYKLYREASDPGSDKTPVFALTKGVLIELLGESWSNSISVIIPSFPSYMSAIKDIDIHNSKSEKMFNVANPDASRVPVGTLGLVKKGIAPPPAYVSRSPSPEF